MFSIRELRYHLSKLDPSLSVCVAMGVNPRTGKPQSDGLWQIELNKDKEQIILNPDYCVKVNGDTIPAICDEAGNDISCQLPEYSSKFTQQDNDYINCVTKLQEVFTLLNNAYRHKTGINEDEILYIAECLEDVELYLQEFGVPEGFTKRHTAKITE